MAENKKSFVLYADLLQNIDHLTNEEKGVLFTHLLEYVNDKNPVLEDRLILTAWKPIERQLKRDLNKFEGVKEERSRSGQLGNLKRYHLDVYNKVVSEKLTLEEAQRITKGRTAIHSDTKLAVNVNDNVNVNVIKKDKYIDFDLLIKFYNETFGREIRVVNAKAKKQIAARIKEGYTKEDLMRALLNAKGDSYHIETKYKYITLEFVSRSDKFERFSQNHVQVLPKPKKV